MIVVENRMLRHAINLLRDEVDRDMALLGITTLAAMRRELLMDARSFAGFGSRQPYSNSRSKRQ